MLHLTVVPWDALPREAPASQPLRKTGHHPCYQNEINITLACQKALFQTIIPIVTKLTICLLIMGFVVTGEGIAQDFSDPADIIQYHHDTTAKMEVDGTIKAVKPGNPGYEGWYFLTMLLVNGKEVQMVVYPKTNFWLNNKPLDNASTYKRFVVGQKLRIMENISLNESTRHLMITDLMFVDKF